METPEASAAVVAGREAEAVVLEFEAVALEVEDVGDLRVAGGQTGNLSLRV